VPPIAYANSYIWILPDGSFFEDSTNVVHIDFSSFSLSGYISVRGKNDCGLGGLSSLFIEVKKTPQAPTITQNGNILTSSSEAGNQWYNQSGLIEGATEQHFLIQESGEYYVIVTIEDCTSEASNSINAIYTTLKEVGFFDELKIFPNPVSDELYIELLGKRMLVKIEIANILGQVIYSGNIYEKGLINMVDFAPGTYTIKLGANSDILVKKIIKK
jgi:hypothetical protein